jgi:hypothetical protein
LLYEIRGDDVRVQVTLQVNNLGGHQPIPAWHQDRIRWTVCKLEERWVARRKMKKDYGEGLSQQQHISIYSMCGISVHSLPVSWTQQIFNVQALKGSSCFQIVHSEHCVGLWMSEFKLPYRSTILEVISLFLPNIKI